jgi:hypothetical protein
MRGRLAISEHFQPERRRAHCRHKSFAGTCDQHVTSCPTLLQAAGDPIGPWHIITLASVAGQHHGRRQAAGWKYGAQSIKKGLVCIISVCDGMEMDITYVPCAMGRRQIGSGGRSWTEVGRYWRAVVRPRTQPRLLGRVQATELYEGVEEFNKQVKKRSRRHTAGEKSLCEKARHSCTAFWEFACLGAWVTFHFYLALAKVWEERL